MGKYIDAEKLKKLLDTKYKEYVNKSKQTYAALQYQYIADGLDIAEQLIDSLQQKQPEEICFKCIYHGKDDDYCYNPHSGMQSLINENGVYECTGFCEKEQEQPEVDLKKETMRWWKEYLHLNPENQLWMDAHQSVVFARHFYELGKNSK